MQDAQDLKRLAADLAMFAQHLQEQNERAVQHVDRSADELQRTAMDMGAGAQQMAVQIVEVLQAQARDAVARGADQAFASLGSQLRDSADQAQRAASALEEQNKALAKAQQGLVFKATGVLVLGSLLVIGATTYYARKSLQEVERARFAKEILEATRSGAITRCGDQLCVRAGKPYGTKGDYVLVVDPPPQ